MAMKCMLLLLAWAVTLDLCCGQRLQYSYLPSDLPNPLRQPEDCGLGSTPAYLCDPNHILTRHERENLNWFLTGLANTNDVCVCSQYYCDTHPGSRSYKVGIALVPRLKLQMDSYNRTMTPLNQAQNFAYWLEHDQWDMGGCQEDIVILYSRDDKALVTMTGRVAGRRLDAQTRAFLHSIVGQHFADGRINEGLLRMVYELRLLLTTSYSYKGMAGTMQAQTGGAPSAVHYSFFILLLSAAVARVLVS